MPECELLSVMSFHAPTKSPDEAVPWQTAREEFASKHPANNSSILFNELLLDKSGFSRRFWFGMTSRFYIQLLINPNYTCAVKRHWTSAGVTPARELVRSTR